MWHVWETGELHTEFWWGRPKGKNYLEDLGVDGRIMLKWRKWDREAWTGIDLDWYRDSWRAL